MEQLSGAGVARRFQSFVVSIPPLMWFMFVFSAVLSGIGPPWFKFAVTKDINPILFVGYMMLFGGASVVVMRQLLARFRAPKIPTGYQPASLLVIVLWFVVFTATLPLFNLAFIKSMQNASAVETSMLVRISPMITFVFTVLWLGSRVRSYSRAMIGYALMMAGVLVITFSNERFRGDNSLWEAMVDTFLNDGLILFGLTAALLQAFSELFREKLRRHSPANIYNLIGYPMIVGGFMCFLYVYFDDPAGLRLPLGVEYLHFTGLGFLTFCLPAVISLYLNQETREPNFAAVGAYIILITTGITGWLLLGETIKWEWHITATVLIVTGVFALLSQLKKQA